MPTSVMPKGVEHRWSYALPEGVDRRQYQFDAADAICDQFSKGVSSGLLVLPTGTGKSSVAAMVAQRVLSEHGHKTLFLAQRRKLVTQAADTFKRFGLKTSIEMGTLKIKDQEPDPDIAVGTIQSISKKRLESMMKHSYDLIIIDEAHHAQASLYKSIISHFSDARLLGMTATPDGSRKNLGNIFQTVAYKMTLRSAIEQGYLVRIKLRTIPVEVDLKDLKMTTSDFNDTEIGQRICAACEILAFNIAANIGDRQTIVFAPDLASASAMASMLRAMGVKAKYVAGSAGKHGMSEPDREKVLAEFSGLECQVVVSCDLLIEGYDNPSVGCIVVCRPTLLRYRYAQMVGRGTRLHPTKKDLLVLDFDWQTDAESKKLCVPVALFSDSTDSKVSDSVAKKCVASKAPKDPKSGQCEFEFDMDLLDLIVEEEEKPKRFVNELAVRYTGRYARRYAGYDSDPVGLGKILDVKLRPKYELSRDGRPGSGGGPATPGQIAALQSMGMIHGVGLTKWGASKVIDKLISRHKRGKASFQQVQRLLVAGVDEDQARSMSRHEAAAVIADAASKKQPFF